MEESAWELSKENIQPLKQGRQPAILSKALRISTANTLGVAPIGDGHVNPDISSSSSTAIRALILQQEKQEFETSLKTCMDTPDPLGIYYRYVRWIEETHPAGKEKEIRELVNKCLTSLREQKWFDKYTNDFRYLYIWLKFASFSKNMGSHTVYEFMLSNGHCVRLAGFYLQWAGELEAGGHDADAAKIFQTGIQMEAQPLQSLVAAYEEFQARYARRLMETKMSAKDDDEETRNVLGVLEAVPRRTTSAATPYMRHSTMEAVKCGKPAPAAVNRQTEFLIYDENDAGRRADPLVKPQKHGQSTGSSIPSENNFCKENVQSADVWTKAKIQQASFVKKPTSGPAKAFAIFVDESAASSASIAEPKNKSRALEASSKSASNIQRTMPDGGIFMCRMDQIYGDSEKSIEELRASRYQPKRICDSVQKTCALRPLSAAATPALRPISAETPFISRPVLTPLMDARASDASAKKVDPICWNPSSSPPGNSSFTQNIYRDAMAAFSNTLHLSGMGPAAETEEGYRRSLQSSAVVPKGNAQTSAFAIFEDPGPGEENDDAVPKEVADKENIDPKSSCSSGVEKKRRNVAGILCPSTEFPCLGELNKDDVIIVEEDEDNRPAVSAAPGFPASAASTTSMGNHTSFDFNESTVAGFHRFLPLNGNRAFSTPCHNASRVQPLSLSSYRPLDFADAEDTGSHPIVIITAPENKGDAASNHTTGSSAGCLSVDVISKDAKEKKLSTIAETSREYVSSSSGSNSTTATSSGNTRRRLLSGASGIATMPSISESDVVRNKLAFGTPFSDAGFGNVLTGASDDGGMRTHGTPYESASVSKSGQKSAAVRKLLLGDENESQRGPPISTGPSVDMAVNPWKQGFTDFQLSRIRPLENQPNYHTFDEKLPLLKAGRTVCLGGETYLILGVAGEGAYAQVYKCNLENEDNSDFALKVQKPCCPIEYYICHELLYRLKVSNMLSTVERGLTSFRDAYMFTDGSVLVGDFTPYGTLLDLVNIYKQISSEKSPPEIIVAYLTADILRIMEAVHSQKIIHGDLKPDNFLVIGAPQLDVNDAPSQVSTVRLIDWGRSIDMALVPPSVTFFGKSNTSGFVCCEMQDGRPYTYQADYYGILGTVHVLAFGDYMSTHKIMSTNRWRISKTFKRRWDDCIWREFFDTFLNVPDCSSLPSLTEWRQRFDAFVASSRNIRPSTWIAEVKKMQDVLVELQRSIAKKKKL